ncbi:MAG: DegV family protein [Clostridia bacterium]|nr:DegV family protein [Clostridia bacterium]
MNNSKIAITTDSNSGIAPEEWKSQGVFVLPMPFLIGGEPYLENVNLTQDGFYKLLATKASVSTSQPSIGDLSEFWTEILKDYDAIVHLPMSSGLSQSCATAQNLAKDFNGKVFVANNRRISVTLKESVADAIKLRESGKSAQEIQEYLEKTGSDSTIYIAVDTMTYLKRGGRVTATAAMIGGILKIKPVLQIRGDKLDKYALARSMQKAKETMKAAIKKDLETEFAEYVQKGEMCISVAHTQNAAEAEIFCKELQQAFPNIPLRYCDPLSLSVSCHIGPGALAVTCSRVL